MPKDKGKPIPDSAYEHYDWLPQGPKREPGYQDVGAAGRLGPGDFDPALADYQNRGTHAPPGLPASPAQVPGFAEQILRGLMMLHPDYDISITPKSVVAPGANVFQSNNPMDASPENVRKYTGRPKEK